MFPTIHPPRSYWSARWAYETARSAPWAPPTVKGRGQGHRRVGLMPRGCGAQLVVKCGTARPCELRSVPSTLFSLSFLFLYLFRCVALFWFGFFMRFHQSAWIKRFATEKSNISGCCDEIGEKLAASFAYRGALICIRWSLSGTMASPISWIK